MTGIDIDIAATILRFSAAALAAVSLICLARVGPGWLAGGLSAVLAGLAVKLDGGTLNRLDTVVDSWFGGHRSPALKADASVVYGYLGEPLHVAAVVVFSATLLALLARSAMRAAVVTGSVGVGVVIEESIKALVYPHGFPSGHVTGAVAFFGMSAVCLAIGRSRISKTALSLLVAVGVLPIAFLALYSGAHSLTDVIGGMVLGTTLVAVGAAILTKSAPRVRLPRAAEVATAVSAHTTPMRTQDMRYGRGY